MNVTRKLSTLDYIFTALSSASTHLDFAVTLHFSHALNLEAINLGAASACKTYPITSSVVYRNRWELVGADKTIEYAALRDSSLSEAAVRNFLTRQIDLRVHPPYAQLLIIIDHNESILVTRFHHAAADGLSAATWLAHQLGVAFGQLEPTQQPASSHEPKIKSLPRSVRRSKFSYDQASETLSSQLLPNGIRRWVTFAFKSDHLKSRCRRAGGFTYNDLLATCALETFVDWNQRHHRSTEVGLWFPVNIRQGSVNGFGNGTSRIRLYPRYNREANIADKARAIRSQIKWCTDNGEWVIPNSPWLQRLPRWATRPAMSWYLNQPSVDMATGVFTHVDSHSLNFGEVFQTVDRIECIGLLHPRQAVAINGTTHQKVTSLTLTYDSGLLTTSNAEKLATLYHEQIEKARQELW